ncbi:MAG: ABC transporter [Epulopiscium sp. Nele67-Bin004]|nr:MAG: ABC transporter [Epulopiscium sp. Nele67-Bin004]
MSVISLKSINKYYGKTHILKDLSLHIEDGDFMTLLGPSGCGKTTTLRVLAGLENPQTGTITMDNEEIVNAQDAYFMDSSKRNLNLVFQSYALWPHMTVFDNVAFGLDVKKEKKDVIKEKVMSALTRMQIDQFAQRYPSELSGGQQQRVAIARAIATDPKLLLLDEPLSNLDSKLRIDMRSELKRLHEDSKATIIYVTHDQTEALTMSTKIAVFFEGEMIQVAPPMELYNNPADLRVADFIGNPRINFISGVAKVVKGELHVKSSMGEFVFPKKDVISQEIVGDEFDIVLGIRPEQIVISRECIDNNSVQATVYTSMPAGSETLITVKISDIQLMIKEIGNANYVSNEKVYVNFSANKMNVFNASNQKLIKIFNAN